MAYRARANRRCRIGRDAARLLPGADKPANKTSIMLRIDPSCSVKGVEGWPYRLAIAAFVIVSKAIRPMPMTLVIDVISNAKEAAPWTTRPKPQAACLEIKGGPERTVRREATSFRRTKELVTAFLLTMLYRMKPKAARRTLVASRNKQACAPEPTAGRV